MEKNNFIQLIKKYNIFCDSLFKVTNTTTKAELNQMHTKNLDILIKLFNNVLTQQTEDQSQLINKVKINGRNK